MLPPRIPPTSRYDAATATDDEGWIAQLEDICVDEGHCDPVGDHHYAFLADEGPRLIVSFETIASARARPRQMPYALTVAEERGWSHLCILADGPTWFRDVALYRHFDRLVDDAFFEDFDQVVFYGAGMGGYAACAYSVCAPGAVVIAVAPRATLDPAIAGWDRRDPAARGLDFTGRYSYAPAMLDAASQAYLIHDPKVPEDGGHATLFAQPFIQHLKAPYLGAQIEEELIGLGVLRSMLLAAGEARLCARTFHQAWRWRGDSAVYLHGLLTELETRGQTTRAARLRAILPPCPYPPPLAATAG